MSEGECIWLNQMPRLIKDIKQCVIDYKSELSALKAKTLAINKSICNLDDVISSIQASSQTQEHKIGSLDTISLRIEEFVADAIQIDSNVADVINQMKDDFYNEYNYLDPTPKKTYGKKLKIPSRRLSSGV